MLFFIIDAKLRTELLKKMCNIELQNQPILNMINRYLLIGLFALLGYTAQAQCPTCTPDQSCVSTDGNPTICPATLPNATTGVYYEGVLTFYLPANVTDPNSGVDATLLQITVTAVDGLPYGMSYSMNVPDATYYPSQGDNYGCATICGTPVLPGTYDMVITVAAVAEAFGFQVTQNQSFTYTLIVDQGAGGTETFSYDQSAGCGNVTVDYLATIGGQPGQLTQYNWNFGNGQTSTEADPAPVDYSGAGVYTASLNTVISNYVLSSVNLNGVNGNWSGDVDDLFSTADPYFTISSSNGTVVYTSSTITNQTSGTWSGVDFTMSAPPYTLIFWDDDDVTQDDLLGSATFALAAGTQNFDAQNGTYGTVMISVNEVTNITSTATVNVFDQPVPDYTVSGNTISASNDSVPTYFWYHDGVVIPGESNSSLQMTESGYYSFVLMNEFGCAATSEQYLYCAPVVPTFNALNGQLSVPDIYESYQWFYNGIMLTGATTYYLISPPNGVYAIQVTNSYGCTLTSNMITVNVGVEELEANPLNLLVYPNPATEVLNLQWESTSESAQIVIRDISGRMILSERGSNGFYQVDITGLSSGNYIIELVSGDYVVRSKFIKN
jgi:hypothetical protein